MPRPAVADPEAPASALPASASAARAVRWDSAASSRRAIDSVLAHVGSLPVALIASSGLSKCIIGAGHVEYVVDDLEEHAQLSGEAAEGTGPRTVVDPRQQ